MRPGKAVTTFSYDTSVGGGGERNFAQITGEVQGMFPGNRLCACVDDERLPNLRIMIIPRRGGHKVKRGSAPPWLEKCLPMSRNTSRWSSTKCVSFNCQATGALPLGLVRPRAQWTFASSMPVSR